MTAIRSGWVACFLWRQTASFSHPVPVILLVPADVLHPRRPDEHYASEAAAAGTAGFDVALVDHGALTRPGGATAAVSMVRLAGEAVYRGWMLRSEQYAAFAQALRQR